MPLKKNQLLSDLVYTRDQLKREARRKKQRVPIICSDDALIEMSQTKPLKVEDFKAIKGIGDVFIDEYAHHFLAVILKHQAASIKEVSVSGSAKKTLDHYKDRLANISRRNRNLYTAKLSKRLGIDLTTVVKDSQIQTFIEGKTHRPLRLSYKTDLSLGNQEEQSYRHLTLIFREINREVKEKGSYDLFIGYPFVEGRLAGEGFEIKAPLLFFPVKLQRKGLDFFLERDTEKDILFNKDLILANNKFNHLETDYETPFIEHYDKDVLKHIVLPHYQANKLMIQAETIKMHFTPFSSHLKADFKRYKKGELHLDYSVVLGKYTMYSSAIQADITNILQSNAYNDLLEGLVEDQTIDYKEDQRFASNGHIQIKEKDLTYINPLNYAQEKVINLIKNHNQIVIWGPPGTGKSQTITSLIANQVNKKENVLIVSEKKVALDVIHSRLKSAAKYVLFIDDAQDKQAFYEQIQKHIDPLPPSRNYNNDIETLNQKIEKIIERLNDISQMFYNPSITNIELYKIYPRYLKTRHIKEELLPPKVHDFFYKEYKQLSFEQLQKIENSFKTPLKLKEMLDLKKALDTYPLLFKVRDDLTRSEVMVLNKFTENFENYKTELNNASFFKRRKLKKYFKQFIHELRFLFKRKSAVKKYLKIFLETDDIHAYLKESYTRFNNRRKKYNNLDDDVKQYIDLLLYHPFFEGVRNIEQYHTYLFDAVYTGYIETFEAVNQDQVKDLRNYHSLMKRLEDLMNEKRHVSAESFEMTLYKDALNFSDSKRIMDIKRRLDHERKWSVRKFVNNFQLELFSNIKIWMMTPESVSEILPLNYGMFDLVIFDEASQMYVEKGIPTIYRAKKVVIAGDTKQLRPSSLGQGRIEIDEELLEEDEELEISMDAKSLLDLAKYKYKETILNYHYRAIYEELIAFSNYAFYDGKLIVSPNQSVPSKPPIEYIYVEEGIWENRQNKKEAEQVIKLIKKVLRTRKNNETIGVITFNAQQRNLIEDYLDQEIFKQGKYGQMIQKEYDRFEEGEDRSLFIKNIENVQGDERDVIIFSTGYAKNAEGRFLRQFGWLNIDGGQNRLNVAISRAKRKIYFIASMMPEAFDVDDLKGKGPKLLKEYMQYCYYVSKNQTDEAAKVLLRLSSHEEELDKAHLTLLQKNVLTRLKRDKLTIHTNIGIGNYTIDFGIFDEETKTYSLGILLDYKSREKTPDVRNYFYHQEQYLKSRGWSIYRLFAPNWYKDANKEMRQIRQVLKGD